MENHTSIVGDMRRLDTWNYGVLSMIILAGSWMVFEGRDLPGNKMEGRYRSDPITAAGRGGK
jgi:hypothetical protein